MGPTFNFNLTSKNLSLTCVWIFPTRVLFSVVFSPYFPICPVWNRCIKQDEILKLEPELDSDCVPYTSEKGLSPFFYFICASIYSTLSRNPKFLSVFLFSEIFGKKNLWFPFPPEVHPFHSCCYTLNNLVTNTWNQVSTRFLPSINLNLAGN